MVPSALESLIARDLAAGKEPFFVNATAGSTVTGAFDPIDAIADVCEKFGLWLHVDVSTERTDRGPNKRKQWSTYRYSVTRLNGYFPDGNPINNK